MSDGSARCGAYETAREWNAGRVFPLRLLREAAHVVRPAGFVYVIHWRYDPTTPRGPNMDIRPRPEQIVEWAKQAGLLATSGPVLDLPPWHYGIRFHRSLGPAR